MIFSVMLGDNPIQNFHLGRSPDIRSENLFYSDAPEEQ